MVEEGLVCIGNSLGQLVEAAGWRVVEVACLGTDRSWNSAG